MKTDPADNQLSADVLHVRLDLGGDIQLVTVECDTLQVREQVLLCGRLRALVRDLPSQLVQLRAGLRDLLSSVNHVHRCL